jgi:hypothetical protein
MGYAVWELLLHALKIMVGNKVFLTFCYSLWHEIDRCWLFLTVASYRERKWMRMRSVTQVFIVLRCLIARSTSMMYYTPAVIIKSILLFISLRYHFQSYINLLRSLVSIHAPIKRCCGLIHHCAGHVNALCQRM